MRTSPFVLLALVAIACDKPAPPAAELAPSAPVSVASITTIGTIPSAAPSAVVAIAPAASASAVTPTHAAATHAPSSKASAAPSAPAPAPEPVKTASKHITGKNFALDLASSGCHASSECAMTIKLVAQGDFHVNKEYPYKFTGAASPNVAFVKTDFSRAAGDFAEQGEKTGVMTVRFKPGSAGDVNVSGTYKMSVCNADQCQVESQPVDLLVPVM